MKGVAPSLCPRKYFAPFVAIFSPCCRHLSPLVATNHQHVSASMDTKTPCRRDHGRGSSEHAKRSRSLVIHRQHRLHSPTHIEHIRMCVLGCGLDGAVPSECFRGCQVVCCGNHSRYGSVAKIVETVCPAPSNHPHEHACHWMT